MISFESSALGVSRAEIAGAKGSAMRPPKRRDVNSYTKQVTDTRYFWPTKKSLTVAIGLLALSVPAQAQPMPRIPTRERRYDVALYLNCHEPNLFGPHQVCSHPEARAEVIQKCIQAASELNGELKWPGGPVIAGSSTIRGGPAGLVRCSYWCSLSVPDIDSFSEALDFGFKDELM